MRERPQARGTSRHGLTKPPGSCRNSKRPAKESSGRAVVLAKQFIKTHLQSVAAASEREIIRELITADHVVAGKKDIAAKEAVTLNIQTPERLDRSSSR